MSSTSANTDENTRPPAIVLSDVDKTYNEGTTAAATGVGASVSKSTTSNSSSIPKDGAMSCAAMSAAARFRDEWLPHADWVVLDGVGHCPQLDVPLEAAELIVGLTA